MIRTFITMANQVYKCLVGHYYRLIFFVNYVLVSVAFL